MSKAEVILLKPVENLGAESDLVTVKSGYARNYLIPQGIAVPVTQANQRRLAVLKQRRAERETNELQHAKDLRNSFGKLRLMMSVRTGDDGKLFGSVTNHQIAEELEKQFEIHLDRRKIKIAQPIKSIGEYQVDMHLHHDVHAALTVIVNSTNPDVKLPDPKAEAAKAEAAAKVEAEKRPARPKRPRKEAPAAE